MEISDFVAVVNIIGTKIIYLSEYGFSLKRASFDSEMMDYWEIIVCLNSKSFLAKLSSERGELFISFCSTLQKPSVWIELDQVIYFLSNSKEFIGRYEGDLANIQQQIDRLNSYLQEYLDRIISFFDTNNFEKYKNRIDSNRRLLHKLYIEKYSKLYIEKYSKFNKKRKG